LGGDKQQIDAITLFPQWLLKENGEKGKGGRRGSAGGTDLGGGSDD